MALVMLPCDLPWWPSVQRHLTQVAKVNSSRQFVDIMQKIHNICNIGLDPDETEASLDLTIFNGLDTFLEEDLNEEERRHFFNFTLPCIAHRALDLKRLRPPNGLHFSLQQHCDKAELDRDFVASLLSHAFFSTFPKRTLKTHPTLQDFNFTNFFRFLHLPHQKCKLKSILHYFNLLESSNPETKIIFSRKVMNISQWLVLDDWLGCTLPLCPLLIRRQGDINSVSSDHVIVCSTRSRIGGKILAEGNSMECVQISNCPEMLAVLLSVEALEVNEVLIVENVMQVANISEPKGSTSIQFISQPQMLTLCCMDPDDYRGNPLFQYDDDSILRELNKILLAFRQNSQTDDIMTRRLSPIGESFSSTPEKDTSTKSSTKIEEAKPDDGSMKGRRRFIVLGSSGECLPVTRHQSRYSSCQSTSSPEPEFQSARTSFTDEQPDDEVFRRYSCQLDKEDRRTVFAERLQEALDRAEQAYSETEEVDPRLVGRDGSCGFVLDGESDKSFHGSYVENYKAHRSASSKYSFTTDYSSELEVVYEQLGRWLDEDETIPNDADMKAIREKAVIQFAGNLLKRTLSESFVGVPVAESLHAVIPTRNIRVAARSLSLELARHKSKLAAQLVSVVLHQKDGLMPVATYSCGCSSREGEPQLKLLIQWVAASVALLPHLVYFTAANPRLNKLDTVCRVLLDRQWSVGELVMCILKFSRVKLLNPDGESLPLFEYIIGNEKSPSLCSE